MLLLRWQTHRYPFILVLLTYPGPGSPIQRSPERKGDSMPSQPAHAHKARTTAVEAAEVRRTRVLQLLLGVVYLAALALLMVWESRDSLEGLSTGCELHDISKSNLYNRPYTRFLQWASADVAGHVVSLAIPAELEEIQNNVCLGRSYTADVLPALDTQNPALIVIESAEHPFLHLHRHKRRPHHAE